MLAALWWYGVYPTQAVHPIRSPQHNALLIPHGGNVVLRTALG